MDNAAALARVDRPGLDWRVLAGLNLFLGALLLFMDCTGYSWIGSATNTLFAALIFAVAIVSLPVAHWCRRRRWLARLACLPSLLEGGAKLALTLFMLLSQVLWQRWPSTPRPIEQSPSPDGRWVAVAYFSSYGLDAEGNGTVVVRVRDRLLPGVERDVYDVGDTCGYLWPEEYLRWQDNDTLYITEKQTQVDVRRLKMNLPLVVTGPISIVMLLFILLATAGG